MKSKYNAKKVTIDGIKFDSKSEGEYYLFLKQMESLGKLAIIELQPKVYLTKTRILYKLDFKIIENGEEIYIDVKGMVTPVFNIKKRLWRDYGAGKLRLVKKVRGGFELLDEIDTLH
jgi:hypothetical protein